MTAWPLLRNKAGSVLVGATRTLYGYGSVSTSRYSNGYEYRMGALIPRSATTVAMANVPVRVVVTSANLKTVANGGRKYNNFDHTFTDSGGTVIPHILEEYSPTTGKLVAWIKPASVSPTASNLIYLYYRNVDISSSTANAASVAAGYGLWLLPPAVTDHALGNNANSGFSSATVGDLTVGSFDGTVGTERTLNGAWLNGKTSFSVSILFRNTEVTLTQNNLLTSRPTSVSSDPAQFRLQRAGNGRVFCQFRGTTGLGSASMEVNNPNWSNFELITVVVNAGVINGYTRGTIMEKVSSADMTGTLSLIDNTLRVGGIPGGGYCNGQLSAIRICDAVISAERAAYEDRMLRFTDSIKFGGEEAPSSTGAPIVERIYLPFTTAAIDINMTNYTYAPTGAGTILSFTTPASGTLTKPNATTLRYTPATPASTTEVSFDVTMRFP